MHVQYIGRASQRILSSADLQKAGVEDFRKTVFPRNTTVEVEDAVGQALVEQDIFGDFKVIDVLPTEAVGVPVEGTEGENSDQGQLELEASKPASDKKGSKKTS